jgi:GntR family transcriptional regulator
MSAGSIDHHSAVPKYLQLATDLRRRIAAGEWAPPERLPSEKQLAAEYGIAVGTVQHTLTVLREEGLVQTFRGRGTGVVPGKPAG